MSNGCVVVRWVDRDNKQWREERTKSGWVYGPHKDAEQRISPYLKPWEELSVAEQQYNCTIARQLPAVLAKADYALLRRRER